ncbi:MAG TPA: isoquinoline 1-oxidoreductase, partial [Phycisphaerales bacterium]|nr:isoquinoline 1-oxidoreductase [Phycisphaerales bacterium]
MIKDTNTIEILQPERFDSVGESSGQVKISRRTFVQMLGAGLLITMTEGVSSAQRRRGGGRSIAVAARVHINSDGTITVMTGKVEEGQGSRAELTQAAAEELRVNAGKIRLLMSDSDLTPDDGRTAGSRTTPSTVPAVRQGTATARELLRNLAAEQWKVDTDALNVKDGIITNRKTQKTITYADLARSQNVAEAFKQTVSSDVALTPVEKWQTMGTSVPRPNSRDIVTGAHRYPSDIVRPNMLYGKTLRPPAYRATLESIDLSKAKAMKDVVVVHEGQFVGFAAPTSFRTIQAMEAVAGTARWKTVPQPSSREIFTYLKEHARIGDRSRPRTRGSIDEALANAEKVLSETYHVAYIQHTPMEPRAAVAEWNDGKLTVWAGVDGPHQVRSELVRALGVPSEQVRVIVPDMGSGFGGKHSGEA